jgi:hypothetical protein
MSNIGIRLGHRALQQISCRSCIATPGCFYCFDLSQTYGNCACESSYSSSLYYTPTTCDPYQDQYTSKADCQFSSENGEVIAIVIGIVVVFTLALICCCVVANSNLCSEENCFPSSPPPPPVASKPPRLAYTPSETAIPIMASAVATREVIDRPESLRVCSVMATDVVLVGAVPLEETITVVPAEGEIIVSPPYDI